MSTPFSGPTALKLQCALLIRRLSIHRFEHSRMPSLHISQMWLEATSDSWLPVTPGRCSKARGGDTQPPQTSGHLLDAMGNHWHESDMASSCIQEGFWEGNLQRAQHCLQVSYCGTVAPCGFQHLLILVPAGVVEPIPCGYWGSTIHGYTFSKFSLHPSLASFEHPWFRCQRPEWILGLHNIS